MSDTLNRIKLQLRPVGLTNGNGDKTPPTPPSAKLLLNHGKPNYTIQRSPKAQRNGEGNPLSPEVQNSNRNNYNPYKFAGVKSNISSGSTTPNLSRTSSINGNSNGYSNGSVNTKADNNNEFVVRSTKFGGPFKPANISPAATAEPESEKVVLRRAPKLESTVQQKEDENVPEFIRRQRRIQERLAKENVLDFESRRSGYFTHVVISPSSPNRTSFVETMASPAIVPSLEIPPPVKEQQKEATIMEEERQDKHTESEQLEVKEEPTSQPISFAATNGTNGHVEEEEVAKAIEEVNKAVAGEPDDDKTSDGEMGAQVDDQQVDTAQATAVAVVTSALIEAEEKANEAAPTTESTATTEVEVHTEVTAAALEQAEEKSAQASEQPKENGDTEPKQHETPLQANGHVANGHNEGAADDNVTISHTNGFNGVNGIPSLPTPDPSGALGVNYESKTVVSFSQELGSEPNKYPDTVKVVKASVEPVPTSDELKELSKLKFDIKADEGDVQVTPVLRTE